MYFSSRLSCHAVATASPRQQEHSSAAAAVAHSMQSFNPMQSYAEDCLHDSFFKGAAPAPPPVNVSPSRIAVPDTIEEENTGAVLVTSWSALPLERGRQFLAFAVIHTCQICPMISLVVYSELSDDVFSVSKLRLEAGVVAEASSENISHNAREHESGELTPRDRPSEAERNNQMDMYAMKNPLFGTQSSVAVSHTGFANQLADAVSMGRADAGTLQLPPDC